jgi:16S rRNA C967 or C1407 C5-methylase (RsmB/RsmF family)
LAEEENEKVIEQFLKQRKDFEKENALDYVDARVVNKNGFIRTYPYLQGLDGTFAASLRKV